MCVPSSARCDGVSDCPDGYDEINCSQDPSVTDCLSSDFQCDNGQCIPNFLRCDGSYDCSDRTDEYNCDDFVPPVGGCNEYEFTCNNGECVSRRVVCDSRPDCLDQSDELYCGDTGTINQCIPDEEYRCSDGLCIPFYFRCDGYANCIDNSDEIDCPSYQECSSSEFRCDDGQCIAAENRCDSRPQCFDASDEYNCIATTEPTISTTTTPPRSRECTPYYEFTCISGECINSVQYCDGYPDCRDGSDESSCAPTNTSPFPIYPTTPVPRPTTAAPTTPSTERYRCANGQFILNEYRCDGVQQCYDNSDEMGCGYPDGGTGSSSLNLKTYPDNQKIKQSREVVFQCRDEGSQRSAVRWSRDNGPMPAGYSDERGRLTIPNIQGSDAGPYSCEAVGVPSNTPGARKTVYLEVEAFNFPVVPAPPSVCGVNQATCMNGECIPKNQICDGDVDCSDASDETRCNPLGCEPNEFQCDNQRCVLKTWICDIDDDCGDGSDERNCGTAPPGSFCNAQEFKCPTVEQCIPRSFHCDGEIDCQDQGDELGCSKATFVDIPPRKLTVEVSQTFILTCHARGVPTPTVIWRLNWGHVPDKCTMTSDDGFGTLTCPNAQPTDQGAYSCEAINIKGSVFVVHDTILTVTGIRAPCVPPTFNAAATSVSECLDCFCFGVTTECFSSDKYISQLPPPTFNNYQLVGVNQDQIQGKYMVRDSQYPLESRFMSSNYRGSAELKVSDRTRLGGPSDLLIYFNMPESHRGSMLESYGGYLRYKISFTGQRVGPPVNGPDVIIRGNGMTIMHVSERSMQAEVENQVDVRFWPGQWYKSVYKFSNRVETQEPATREEILMVLENVELLLIRALYIDALIVDATLSDIQLDTAIIGSGQTSQGRAVYVEQCRCPRGYVGISCQECAPNYRRVQDGSYLGRCVLDIECRADEYGDPANGIPCLPCPCPLTNPGNQFGSSCFLDSDSQVTCNCPYGYSGRRCESCSPGYEGSPSTPGDYCKPAGECDPAGSLSASVDPTTGQCQCKEFTTGAKCDQCQPSSFYLNENNQYGCIQCFCMSTTPQCTSSRMYRSSETMNFASGNAQGLALVDETQTTVITSLRPSADGEMVYDNFSRLGGENLYWRLPIEFLGNKLTSYGGNLTYTIKYVPAPGGLSSKNNAHDVEIFGNSATFRYYSRGQSPRANSQDTISVPLYAEYWQRDDGLQANREHLLMALARVNYILIKATYTTTTSQVGISSVSLDTAEYRNTGGERAYAVEECECPIGYKGLSCEECSVGYTRGLSGLYLGDCIPCDCNGRSTECDPDSGECMNCRDNTAGFYCDECQPGYDIDPSSGICYRATTECSCDADGSASQDCVNGQCQCKENVQGDNCNLCRSGYFDLSYSNAEGCTSCWCSGVTNQCFSSNLYLMQIPMNLLSPDHGFVLTNRYRTETINEGLKIDISENEITYDEFQQLGQSDTIYWSLPPAFTGNLMTSYGGNISVTQSYESASDRDQYIDVDVIIRGSNGRELAYMLERPLMRGRENIFAVPLLEQYFTIRQYPASRNEMLEILSSVEAILVRATPTTSLTSSTLKNVIMDTAIAGQTGLGRAVAVEQCRCPPEYNGLSCEKCVAGHYKQRTTNRCLPCNCNGHETSCEDSPNGRLVCNCQDGYFGDYCEKSEDEGTGGIPTVSMEAVIEEPIIQVVAVGSTVTYFCRSGVPYDQSANVFISWGKEEGDLPYGRAYDDRTGRLQITRVQVSDSGTYICTVSDGFSRVVQNRAQLTVEGESESPEEPRVQIEETRDTVQVTVGQYYEVRCRAQGFPAPSVSWYRQDNRPLPQQVRTQDGLLVFQQITSEAEGTYVCLGSNVVGQSQAVITIYVQRQQQPTVAPEDPGTSLILVTVTQTEVETAIGGTVRVDCSAPAQYILAQIRWSRANSQLPQQASQREGELVIPNAQPEDSGLYVCKISTNDGYYGEATTRINIVRAYNIPTVRIEPDRQTISQGTSAEVRCIAIGDPTPTITWTKVNEDMGRGVRVEGDVLRITNAQISDRGMYVCDASSSGGTARAVTLVEVERLESPSIKMYPENSQSIQRGGSALFQCHLTGGIPTPVVTWRRTDGRPLTPSTELKPGGVIMFNDVTGDEAGTYTCTAVNNAGEVKSTASLEIYSPPVITLTPSQTPLQVREGQRVRLQCSAAGDPTPSVSWHLLDSNFPTELQSISTSPSSAEFEIASARREDTGTYKCTATNSAGTSEQYIQVFVEAGQSTAVQPTARPATRPPFVRPSRPAPQPTARPTPPPYDNKVAKVPAGANYEFRCIPLESSGDDISDVESSFRRSDGRSLPPTHRVSEGVLYLFDVQPSDAGEYACIGSSRSSGSILYTIYATIQVVGPPRITLEPPRQVVRPGDYVSLRCLASGDQPIDITWAKEGGRMPPSVIINYEELIFQGIEASDAGKYLCTAVNSAGRAAAVAEVVVNVEPLLTALESSVEASEGESLELRCETSGVNPASVTWTKDGTQLPPNAFARGNVVTIQNADTSNRGNYVCEARTQSGTTYDVITLSLKRPNYLDVVVTGSLSSPRVGGSIQLTCNVSDDYQAAIKWSRYGGSLPINAVPSNEILAFSSLSADDGGTYVCTVTTPLGVFEETYNLAVQNEVTSEVIEYAPNSRSVVTRSAKFGSTVVLKCQAQLSSPASFTWIKQDGQIPFQAIIRDETLEIPSVHADDAGTYLCTARNDQRTVDLPIMLVVTGVVPKFNSDSYLVLPTISDAYLQFDIEISFRPDSDNGIILYNSRRDETSGDFLAFGLQDGYAVYQFDVGSGMMSLESNSPLALDQWHTIKISRNRKNGYMSVDGKQTLSGETEGRHVGLELLEPLYVGGVPIRSALNSQSNFTGGFEGCISRLVVQDNIVELMRDADDKVSVGECNICRESPCENSGVCQESYTSKGFKCICPAGYSGDNCSETGQSCVPNICGEGRCSNKPGGYDCYCPYGRTGLHCEKTIVINEPMFAEGSYIAYSTPSAIKRFSMGLNVKPKLDLEDGLLMYCAQNEQGDGDFTSLALRNKRVEFKFNTGTGTATLTSEEIQPGQWLKIHANRTDRLGSLRIDDGKMIHGQSPGVHKGLNLRIPLYIGGVDSNTVEITPEVKVKRSFSGCISQINVNEREVSLADISNTMVGSSNINQCEASNFEGPCDKSNPCKNGGVCNNSGEEDFTCACPLGFSGQMCDQETLVEKTGSFSGQSWVEFDRKLGNSGRYERTVALELSTTETDGLLVWHGQENNKSGKDKDYFSAALVDGYVELRFRTRDGQGFTKSTIQVNDGARHLVKVVLGDQLATLQVDSAPVETAAKPSNAQVNAMGGIFIGGVPNAELMTDGLYSSGFEGCLHSITLGSTNVESISDSAISGLDVVPCSSG